MTKDVPDRLLYRRQFVMGPSFVDRFAGWARLSVNPSLCLTVHPDLPTLRVEEDGRSVTLLGYILDPAAPSAGDRDILLRLLKSVGGGAPWRAFTAATADLGGRWVLIVDDGSRVRLMTDPCGYRQVVFTGGQGSHGVWCASQPGLLAEVLDLVASPEAASFIEHYRKVGHPSWRGAEYWWPGDSSLYDEIHHLLPNHDLDLSEGESSRFWPDRELSPLPLEEVVERNARLLAGIIRSASARFDLALPMTAGKDSRLLLAATRPIADRMFYFTLLYWDLNEESIDLVIPRRLLPKLGLTHHVIRCPAVMEPWFEGAYKRNVSTAHDAYGTIAQGLFNDYPRHRVCMKGNGIHVIRGFERLRAEVQGAAIDAQTLLRIGRIADHPFARRALDRWLADAGSRHNVDLINLFYWENKEGSWQAMAQLEWDVVLETLAPYNCRSFLANGLALDPRFRGGPSFLLHHALMSVFWPDVLQEPMNALAFSGGRMMIAARDFLVRKGLYRHVVNTRRSVRSFASKLRAA